MSLEERILRYVRRYHAAHFQEGGYPWPKLARVARALRERQQEVHDCSLSLPLMLTDTDQRIGEQFVEICE